MRGVCAWLAARANIPRRAKQDAIHVRLEPLPHVEAQSVKNVQQAKLTMTSLRLPLALIVCPGAIG